ncbi:c-type cytochrome [Bradyrhizobium sp.]|uniref:c-type cytochrome n=1 Tax=Bradyrhizobium sp. TaxID=376 RepID=UPI004037A740
MRTRLALASVAHLTAVIWIATAAPGAENVRMEPVRPAAVAADPVLGRQLYGARCAQCHGEQGKGDGPAAEFVYPRPRDFTLALFKVRSTLSGQVPTDDDLFRVISEGLPGTSMPAWKKLLTENERWQLVHYVKTFDEIGVFKDEPAKQQVVTRNAPRVTPDLIKRGEALYEAKKCWQCHGKLGRGEGPSASGMKDDWGQPIRPVNFTKSWRFRGGDSLEDIYRTFTTGFNGTPMPSFLASIPDEGDRWALAAYVKSLSRPLKAGQVLKATHTKGDIPADPGADIWDKADDLDVPLAGQIILEPRWFKPANDVISAKALYNDKEIAIRVTWDDGTHNEGRDGKPPDQVALQFPADELTRLGGEKPYFVLGDHNRAIEHWRWSAGTGLKRTRAFGHDRTEAVANRDLRAAGTFVDGQYQVVFRRTLRPESPGSLTFSPGQFIPIAFHLWNGGEGEEELKMALSAWHYVLPQSPTPTSTYLWPMFVGALVVGGEAWLARRMRRRRSEQDSESTVATTQVSWLGTASTKFRVPFK